METETDRDLMQRAQAGDKDAFSVLVKRHQASLRGIAARLPIPADAVFDLVQECLVRCWLSRERFDLEQPFLPWAKTILRNLANNHFRDSRVSRTRAQNLVMDALTQAPTLDELLTLPTHEPDVRMRALQDCCHHLPAEQQTLLTLRYNESLAIDEIANRTQKNAPAVAMALSRLRSVLARCVQGKLEVST